MHCLQRRRNGVSGTTGGRDDAIFRANIVIVNPMDDIGNIGAWGGQEFVRIIMRHMARKAKYPDEVAARARPYEGVENLRPETKAAVEAFLAKQRAPAM